MVGADWTSLVHRALAGEQDAWGELYLTPMEYKLLCVMAQNVGKVLTLSYITQKVWGGSTESDIASLRVFMTTLRKKLDAQKGGTQYIQTHIGVGYRMLRV